MTALGAFAPARRRDTRLWVLLLVLAGNMLIDALEVSVVLVALPTISGDMGLSLWTAQWLLTGFALGFAALLLLGPRITGRWGRRPVYLAAMAVFVLASVAGALAEDAGLLIATRVLKGACAALTAPTGLAIIATAFPAGPEQRRAVSVYSLFGTAGFTAGVLLAGALSGASWRWTFALPAAVACVLLVLAIRYVPREGRDGSAGRGAARFPARPALPGNGPLLRSALGAATLNGTYLAVLLMTVFELSARQGWSPWQCALALLPACLPPALAAPFAARMVARFGTARLIAAGAVAALTGYALLLRQERPDGYLTGVLPTLSLVGAAFVLSFAALNTQAFSEVPQERRAVAVPLYQCGVQLGAVCGLLAVSTALTHGVHRTAALIVVALGALGAAVALTGLRSRRPQGG